LVLLTKVLAVWKAWSQLIPSKLRGFRGRIFWNLKTRKRKTNKIPLKIKSENRYCFQFISLSGSIFKKENIFSSINLKGRSSFLKKLNFLGSSFLLLVSF